MIIRNKILPFGKRFAAINLFGILFVRPNVSLSDRLIRHESIHSRQMRELLFIPFYIIYVAEWLVRIVMHRGNAYDAYRNISFEREAYEKESDDSYLRSRPTFAFLRYL